MIPYIKVIKQYERLAVFTLGKYSGLMQPGLRLLFWPFHATHSVDLREEVLDIPRQTNITKDNAPIEIVSWYICGSWKTRLRRRYWRWWTSIARSLV